MTYEAGRLSNVVYGSRGSDGSVIEICQHASIKVSAIYCNPYNKVKQICITSKLFDSIIAVAIILTPCICGSDDYSETPTVNHPDFIVSTANSGASYDDNTTKEIPRPLDGPKPEADARRAWLVAGKTSGNDRH